MKKDINTYIFYHANCNDGFGAAWSAFKRFGWDDAKYKPCSYGKPLPHRTKSSGCRIYFVDMSTTPAILDELVAQGNEVIVIDHHDTAEQSLSQYDRLPEDHNYNWDNGREIEPGVSVRFDMKKSGAMLAWEYFQPGLEVPKIIKYIQDRDIWTKELPYTEEINGSLASHRFKFDEYEEFARKLEEEFDSVVAEGVGIKRCRDQIMGQIAASHRVVEWKGHKVAVCNVTTLWSDVGNWLLEMYEAEPTDRHVRLDAEGKPIRIDYSIGYSIHSKGSRFMMSMRSKGDFKVNEISKREFGGGGHPNAAGANVDFETGMALLKEWGIHEKLEDDYINKG